jgi:hypothetical protein
MKLLCCSSGTRSGRMESSLGLRKGYGELGDDAWACWLPVCSSRITTVSVRMVEDRFVFFCPRCKCKGTSVHSLTPLFLTMSICIPHGLYTYPTTSVPLRPPSDNRRSSSISRYSTILPTSSQPRLMPHNYHRLHRDRVTRPYGTLQWSSDFHIWKAWY